MNLNKLCLITTGFAFSLSSFAFTPDCCLRYSSGLCSPKLRGGFYVGVTGLYVKPSESGPGQGTDSWQFIDTFGPANFEFRSEDRPAKPNYDWQWGVNVGYDIPCTAYNLEASYFTLHSNTHAVTDLSFGDPVTFSPFFITNILFPINAGTGTFLTALVSDSHLIYDLDQADIKLGRQFADVCGHFQLQLAVGARYADLEHELRFHSPATLNTIIDDTTIVTDGFFSGSYKSEFQGVGPLLSLDLRYGLCRYLGLVGRFNSSIMFGDIDSRNILTSELAVISPTTEPVVVTSNRFHRPTLDRVVPNADAKLGVDFTYCFVNRSSLSLEVGYQASKYWESFTLLRGDASTNLTPLSQRITGIETTSFAFRGPYATLTWHI